MKEILLIEKKVGNKQLEGLCVMLNKKCVIIWSGDIESTCIYNSWKDLEKISKDLKIKYKMNKDFLYGLLKGYNEKIV